MGRGMNWSSGRGGRGPSPREYDRDFRESHHPAGCECCSVEAMERERAAYVAERSATRARERAARAIEQACEDADYADWTKAACLLLASVDSAQYSMAPELLASTRAHLLSIAADGLVRARNDTCVGAARREKLLRIASAARLAAGQLRSLSPKRSR
jgi:hypothetical protein